MKTIKKLSLVMFSLTLLVLCFCASTMTAYADDLLGGGTCSCGRSAVLVYCDARETGTVTDSEGTWTLVTHTHDYYCSTCNRITQHSGSFNTHNYGDFYSQCTGSEPPHSHSYSYGAWSPKDDTNHQRTGTCSCGTTNTQTNPHNKTLIWCTVTSYSSYNSYTHKHIYRCSTCGKVITQNETKTSGGVCGSSNYTGHNHSFGGWTYNSYVRLDDSRCIRSATRPCNTADCVGGGSQQQFQYTSHSWNWTDNYQQKPGGSTSQHQRQQKCRNCGTTKWVDQGHSMQAQNDKPIPEGTNALTIEGLAVIDSCKAYRKYSDSKCERKYVCQYCQYTEWRRQNHSWNPNEPYESISSTQHANYHTCKNCSWRVRVTTQNHSLKNTVVGGEDGHKTVKACTTCGYHDASGTTQPHNYGSWSSSTSGGVKTSTRTCSTCKYIDQTVEIVGKTTGLEYATVVSEPMTMSEFRAAAGTRATSPEWKASIGTSGNFDSSKADQTNYVWSYNGSTYTLSKRPDGKVYVSRVPTYYWERIKVYNPNANVSPGSGSTYSSSSRSELHSDGTPNPSVRDTTSSRYNAEYNSIVRQVTTFTGGDPTKDVTKCKSDSGYQLKTGTPDRSKGETSVMIDGHPCIKDKNGKFVLEKSVEVYVHSCSWSTSYQDFSATQHTKIRRSCCGGHSESKENHNYGNWTYTDLGSEQHRAERICKNCGHVDTKVENHNDTNRDDRCDQCTRLLYVTITWRWYDEHTPVKETTRQRYYRGIVMPETRGRMDYKFTGWFTEWGGVGDEWVEGDSYPYNSPTQLFASWKALVHLEFDLSAPVITVTRQPNDPSTPYKNVKLTITAVDPDGHDHELPLQIEGETTWHPSPWTFTVTESKPITIVARDTKNNTREFVVNVQNVDVAPPVIEGITQDVTGWTNKPVTLMATATDDQKLHATAYQWEYTPNSTGVAVKYAWTAVNTLKVSEAGKARVQVRDWVGNTVWSDYYPVYNIDTTPPGLDPSEPYTVSTTETVAASTGVTITLNLWDTPDSVTNMSSGLAASPIKWVDSSDIYTTQRTITVHSNGIYKVILKDAVGNESGQIPINIGNISTSEPTISDLYGTDVDGDRITYPIGPDDWAKAPVTLTVDATFGDAGQPEKPYSWDGGLTWTSLNTYEINTNGEYTVMIRDANGTTKTESIVISNADDTDPVVNMLLYKGKPDDWDTRFPGRPCGEEDYVWKLQIDAEDLGGSGIDKFYTQWDGNQEHDASELPMIFDVTTPGTYQVKVVDKAGNSTTMEKVAQWTDLGESVEGPNPNVPIVSPDVGGGTSSTSGSAGQPFDANLEDLVFGPTGAYNTKTGVFTEYPEGMKGIPVRFNAQITRNRYGTAEVSFNNAKYPAQWEHQDLNGHDVTLYPYKKSATSTAVSDGVALGTGDPIPGYAFIPITDITGDVKNARIRVTVREWDKYDTGSQQCSDLLKEGVENFYTSVQNSKPTVTYTYNRVTDQATVTATSAIAGMKEIYYGFADSEAQAATGSDATIPYTGPFPLAGHEGKWLVFKAIDKLGNTTIHYVSVDELAGGLLNGASEGAGSLPQTTLDGAAEGTNGTSSYHSSNRAADIYIIGGTRGNTSQVPSGDVFNALLAP